MRHSIRAVTAATAVAAVATWGWNQFWFLTDDAFIAFRYASNLVHGRGPVWNPEPFLPVEGYTSPSWVLLLSGLWSAFGVEPPATANVVGLACSLGVLALCAWMCRRQRAAFGSLRGTGVLSVGTLLAIATQPTFLTWSSSGLETPLFNLCFIAWVVLATASLQQRTAWWAFGVALAATLCALTRPEGMLTVFATLALLGPLAARGRLPRRSAAAAALPMALVAAHLIWRRAYYGFWLPNTYYAKVLGAWPEAGWRYLAVFVVAHGVWLWAPVVALAFPHARRAAPPIRTVLVSRFGHLLVLAVSAVTIGYYTFVVGGDHFGFRAFSVFVPLLFIVFHWACLTLPGRTGVKLALLAAFAVSTHGIGWNLHLASERSAEPTASIHPITDATPRWLCRILEQPVPRDLFVPMSLRVPSFLSGAAEVYDGWSAWLNLHFVGLPRASHIASLRIFVERAPTRDEGARISWEGRPVVMEGAAGYIGWVLPNVAIIDGLGLNDRVIARCPPPPSFDPRPTIPPLFQRLDRDGDGLLVPSEIPGGADSWLARIAMILADADRNGALDVAELEFVMVEVTGRRMAHDRAAPPGYVDAFRPNVRIGSGRIEIDDRGSPLLDDDIRIAETRFMSSPH